MSESRCRVCSGGPVLAGFCWKCYNNRAADRVLFEKSDEGTLTAGELPVGAVFRVASFGERALRALENQVEIIMAQHDVLPTGVLHFAAGAIVTLISLPKPEPAPAKLEVVTLGELKVGEWFVFHEIECKDVFRVVSSEAGRYVHVENRSGALEAWLSYRRVRRVPAPTGELAPAANTAAAPPDSELPTYDEVMGALGERWTVCDSVWTHVVPMTVRNWKGNELEYPGPWFHFRGDGLPYLNLQRDDGQRVRFEVPGDWLKTDTLRFLKSVSNDYRGTIPHSPYARHVRWLPMAESEAKENAEQLHKLEVATGQHDRESLTTASNTKALPSNITMKDIMETAELVKKCAPPPSDDRPELTWVCPWNPMPLTTKTLGDAADRIRSRPDFSDMLRVTVKRKLDKRSAEILGNWLGERVMLGVDLAADEDVGGVSVVYECAPCRTCKKNHAGPSGQCLGCRWRRVPADQVPRLERLLAEQVASGGQDCDASRSLLVRREKLIAEERERRKSRLMSNKRGSGKSFVAEFSEASGGGISSLRLEKPLIAYKRSRS